MILSYFNILAVTLTYNVYKNMTEWVHLDIITDQIGWISVFFKKCGARIETKGKFRNNKYGKYTSCTILGKPYIKQPWQKVHVEKQINEIYKNNNILSNLSFSQILAKYKT